MDFSEQISSEKERLSKERDEAAQLLAKTTERLQTLERQLEAIDAYESIMGPSAKAAPKKRRQPATRKRNTNRTALSEKPPKARRKALAARESSKHSIAKATSQPSKL